MPVVTKPVPLVESLLPPWNLPPWNEESFVLWKEKPTFLFPWRGRSVEYACGHKDSPAFILSIFGIQCPILRQKEYCSECRLEKSKKEIIRCCYCTRPIFPGSQVCLYDEDSPGIRKEVSTKTNHHYVIGCNSKYCEDRFDLYFGILGYWTPEGFKSLNEV